MKDLHYYGQISRSFALLRMTWGWQQERMRFMVGEQYPQRRNRLLTMTTWSLALMYEARHSGAENSVGDRSSPPTYGLEIFRCKRPSHGGACDRSIRVAVKRNESKPCVGVNACGDRKRFSESAGRDLVAERDGAGPQIVSHRRLSRPNHSCRYWKAALKIFVLNPIDTCPLPRRIVIAIRKVAPNCGFSAAQQKSNVISNNEIRRLEWGKA